jgi:hypothetical protein
MAVMVDEAAERRFGLEHRASRRTQWPRRDRRQSGTLPSVDAAETTAAVAKAAVTDTPCIDRCLTARRPAGPLCAR